MFNMFNRNKKRIRILESKVDILTDAILQMQIDYKQLDSYVMNQQQLTNATLRRLISSIDTILKRGEKQMVKKKAKKKKK